ncbi:MAG: protein kinase [Candidatus Promineifilaceae bacterium]
MESESTVLNNRYKLLQRAGTGGMASVYKGQDLMLGRLVAVKVLHESLTGNAEFLRRFQQEAYAAANLSHPNIVTVHDIGQDGHYYYIVMEYIEGQTLKELIRRQMNTIGEPLNINRALDLAIQICAGIGYAHRANLVHCDVKSQNVLVTRDNRVKVADFGIARAMSQSLPDDDYLVWGTPQYFSPEQAAGEAATPASDVYAIGVIMFEMLTGRLPFDAESHTALAVKHMRETPPLVTQFNPAVPQQIERVIAKVLSKEPAGRYRTADQFGRILTTYRDSSLEDTGPVSDTGPRPRPAENNITERKTIFYHPEERTAPLRESIQDMPTAYPPPIHISDPIPEGTDWGAIILGVVALISLIGLIPLWYIVYLRYAG